MAVSQGIDPTGRAVAQASTAAGEARTADLTVLDALLEVLGALRDVRDECRATRLAVEEMVNRGEAEQLDFLELAQELGG